VDDAIRRRVLLIPFIAVIPDQARDPQLAETLRAERPEILQWMIEGCLAWQRDGLAPPDAVRAATDRYLDGADAFKRWLDECCRLDPNEKAPKAAAFGSWRRWADAAGEYIGTARRLADRLAGLPGVDEARDGRTRYWIGVGLLPEPTPPPGE
jgi:putative DNA primase/helicase